MISVLCLTKHLDATANICDPKNLLVTLLSEESKVESIGIPCYNFMIPCTSKLGVAMMKANGLKKLVIYDHVAEIYNVHLKQFLFPTYDETLLKSNEMRVVTKSQICSGIILILLKYIRPEDVEQLLLDDPKVFEDCPNCSGSGRDVWKSICNIIKNSKHIQHLKIPKSHFNAHDMSSLMANLHHKTNLHTLKILTSKLSQEGLIHLRNNLPRNVCARVSTQKLTMHIYNDNPVHVDINFYEHNDVDSEDLCFLKEELPQQLHGVTVYTNSFVSKAVLRSLINTKMVLV